jgi:hypothetical protein
VLLGLNEKNAKYAAYVLHGIFSYPTSENWLPTTTSIHIARMSKTRWGKNWGSFERIEWVDDVEIDEVRTTINYSHIHVLISWFYFIKVLCVSPF